MGFSPANDPAWGPRPAARGPRLGGRGGRRSGGGTGARVAAFALQLRDEAAARAAALGAQVGAAHAALLLGGRGGAEVPLNLTTRDTPHQPSHGREGTP